MALTISDEQLNLAHITEQELAIEVACILFEKNKFTLGQASKFASIPIADFMQELGSREIPLHYSLENYEEDFANANKYLL